MNDISDVKWLIGKRMFTDEPYANLPEVIASFGMECRVIDNIAPHIDDPYAGLFPLTDCVIPYLPINSARRLCKYYGMYMREDALLYHTYTSLMGVHPSKFLNDDFLMTTFYNFKRTYGSWYDRFNTDRLFVRPDSGIKTFTGTPIWYIDCDAELRTMNDKIDDNSIIHIGSCKQFTDETRFIICDNKIVSGSRYSTNSGNLKVEDRNYPPELLTFGEEILTCKWKPDEVFTLDVCMTENGPKIVEINSFSCAGWYAADPYEIVKAVSEHTLKLFNEQYN